MVDKLTPSVSREGVGSPSTSPQEDDLNITKLEEEILSLLIGQERYGLEITQAFEEASDGKRKISVGTLYPTLSRLEEKGLVISRMGERPQDEKGGARRKYFKITQRGVHALGNVHTFRKRLSTWQPAL